MSRRAYLARALDRMGILDACLRTRALTGWPRWGLTVLLYHRVLDLAEVGELDPDLIDATPATFEEQMATMSQHLTPVTLDEVLDATCSDGRPLPANAVLVTFDDGYTDNLEVAVPILKRHGIRATFFVATDYTTERRLFWWERIRIVVDRARVPKLTLTYPTPFVIPLDSNKRRRQAVRHLRRIVKDYYDLDLERLLAELSSATDVPWTKEDCARHAQASILSWDGVRAIRDAGMDVASHTGSHRVLQTLPPAALAHELAASRAALEAELGTPVRALAYPVGRRIAAFPEIREAIQHAGYELGFAVEAGLNHVTNGDAGAPHLFDLKRIPVDRTWSTSQFRATLVHHAFGA
jgi:peptidoglycan/xylan/chitin deacetylase (PgdA/CDA1 family)